MLREKTTTVGGEKECIKFSSGGAKSRPVYGRERTQFRAICSSSWVAISPGDGDERENGTKRELDKITQHRQSQQNRFFTELNLRQSMRFFSYKLQIKRHKITIKTKGCKAAECCRGGVLRLVEYRWVDVLLERLYLFF